VIVELYGLEVFGPHGVLEAEQREGQTLLFDVALEVDEPAGDRIEDAVDYREVVARIQEVSDVRRFALLEALAVAVADALVGAFPVRHVRVRVRKPRPAGVPAEWAAATAERPGARVVE
jgi:dihydroneopterin aldolase